MSWIKTKSGTVNPDFAKKVSRSKFDADLAHFTQEDRDYAWNLTHDNNTISTKGKRDKPKPLKMG